MKRTLFCAIFFSFILSAKAQNADTLKGLAADTFLYVTPEHPAQFPGGLSEFGRFLAQTIRYPEHAFLNNIHGRVIVQITIEKDGSLSHITVIRKVSPLLDKEAIRVVSTSPKWIPATQNGKAVRMIYALPIVFNTEPIVHKE